MKLSGYYKDLGDKVTLITEYNEEELKQFDEIFLSKVFTETEVPSWVLELPNIEYGGTGFYYDKAPKLDCQIEHHMPDYHLYDDWIQKQVDESRSEAEEKGKEFNLKNFMVQFKYYTDYSIGFTTRGCFRQCPFCVNRNYKKVEVHSALDEFIDQSRKKICLLDDNILGSPQWGTIFEELQSTGKPFQYKQGMDERLLTDEKCEVIFKSKYDGDYIFAFDNVEDYDLIERKLQLLRKYTDKIPKFYTFCGFDRADKWDDEFWKQDLWDIFKRIELLMEYHCLPYIMRFARYEESPYRGTYINLAAWCNQPNAFKKKSYREFVEYQQSRHQNECSETRYLKQVEKDIPELAEKYFDMKWKNR